MAEGVPILIDEQMPPRHRESLELFGRGRFPIIEVPRWLRVVSSLIRDATMPRRRWKSPLCSLLVQRRFRYSLTGAYGWPGPLNLLNPILVRQVLPEAYMPEKPKPGAATRPPLPTA